MTIQNNILRIIVFILPAILVFTLNFRAQSPSLTGKSKTADSKSKSPVSNAAKTQWRDKQLAKIIRCADGDGNCFIRAVEKCRAATVKIEENTDLWGINFIGKGYFEIIGGTKDNCVIYHYRQFTFLSLSQKAIESLKKTGQRPKGNR